MSPQKFLKANMIINAIYGHAELFYTYYYVVILHLEVTPMMKLLKA